MKVSAEKYLFAEMGESNIYRKDLGRGGSNQKYRKQIQKYRNLEIQKYRTLFLSLEELVFVFVFVFV